LPIIVEHWAMIGTEEEEEVRAAADKWKFVPKAWEYGYFDNISPVDIQSRARKEIPIETVLRDWTVSDDPEIHMKVIRELGNLGATHVVVHVAAPDQLKFIDYFGRSVLPGI
jgi:hypothetical protein